LKTCLESFDVNYKKTQENIKECRAKQGQCHADKLEILRDLATYETNYAKACGFNEKIMSILGKVQ
jgi:hypothetical protein